MAAAGTIIIGGGGYALLRYIHIHILYYIVYRRDTEIFATYNDDNNEKHRGVVFLGIARK